MGKAWSKSWRMSIWGEWIVRFAFLFRMCFAFQKIPGAKQGEDSEEYPAEGQGEVDHQVRML